MKVNTGGTFFKFVMQLLNEYNVKVTQGWFDA